MRIAIVGLDSSHAEHYVRFLNTHCRNTPWLGNMQLSALVDTAPEPDKARAQTLLAAAPHGTTLLRGTPQEVAHALRNRSFAAIVATRSSGHHFAYTHALLSAGVPTFVDKPFTSTLSQAQELIRLAQQTGIALTSFSALRWHPLVKDMARHRLENQPTGTFKAHGSAPGSPYGPDFMSVHTVEAALTLGGGRLLAHEVSRTEDTITADLLTQAGSTRLQTRIVLDCSPEPTTMFSIQAPHSKRVALELDQDYLLPGFTAWLCALQSKKNLLALHHLEQTVAVTEQITLLL